MNRRRRASTFILCAIGAVLILAWVRSYSVSDGFFWKDKRVMLRAVSSRGGLLLGYWKVVGSEDMPQVGLGYSRRLPRELSEMPVRPELSAKPDWSWSGLGLVIERERGLRVHGGMSIVPYWMLLAVGISPVLGKRLVWRPIVRWRRRRRGRCETCSYDLRGSAERCPECGTGCVRRAIGRIVRTQFHHTLRTPASQVTIVCGCRGLWHGLPPMVAIAGPSEA